MARSSNFYSPIQRALENFNESQDRRFAREIDYKQREQATRLAHEQRMAQAQDPRNQLAIKRAQHELEPQTINLKNYIPANMQDKRSVEAYNEFKSYLPSFTNGKGASIRKDGIVLDEHNQPLQMPRFQARQVNNRVQFSVAANQNGIAQREREIEMLKLQREEEKNKLKTLPPDQMKLRLGGFDTQIEALQKDLDNPKFRLMELNKTRRNFMNLYQRAALDNSDPQFLNALKYKIEGINDQMEMLLPAKGLKSQLVSVWKEDGGRVIENRVPYTEVGKYTSSGWKEGKPQYQSTPRNRSNRMTILQGQKALSDALKGSFFVEGKQDAMAYYNTLLEQDENMSPLTASNKAREYFSAMEKEAELKQELERLQTNLEDADDPWGPNFLRRDQKKVDEAKAALKDANLNHMRAVDKLNTYRFENRQTPTSNINGTITNSNQWDLPEDEFNSLMDEMKMQGIDTTDADQVDAYIMHYMSNR